MTELSPCPFCGSKPSIETRDWSVTIYCSSRTCGCCAEAEGTGLDCAAEAWNRRHAHRALDEEVYRGLQEAKVLIGAKNDNVSEAIKASNINAAWHILDRILSDGGASVYCAHCEHEHPLHEDARGFHHVIRGERVPCGSVSSTVRCGDAS